MENPKHLLSNLQERQADFERELPKGLLFDSDNVRAAQEYGALLTVLARDFENRMIGQLECRSILMHGFIATLSIVNQYNLGLSTAWSSPEGVDGVLDKLLVNADGRELDFRGYGHHALVFGGSIMSLIKLGRENPKLLHITDRFNDISTNWRTTTEHAASTVGHNILCAFAGLKQQDPAFSFDRLIEDAWQDLTVKMRPKTDPDFDPDRFPG